MKIDITNEEMQTMMELFSILQIDGMAQDYKNLLNHVAELEQHVAALSQELKAMKEFGSLGQVTSKRTQTMHKEITRKIDYSLLSNKVGNLANNLKDIKNTIVSTATKALTSFKEKGKDEMNKVLLKGSEKIRKKLLQYREDVIDTLQHYRITEEKIDRIGSELKNSQNSLKNAGRLILGKETKEADNEKIGVTITRIINTPIKNSINHLQQKLEKIDNQMEKLDIFVKSLSKDRGSKEVNQEIPLLEDKSSIMHKLEKNKQLLLTEKVEAKQPEKVIQFEQEH